jgi:phytoene dehydrogenase-like protein
MMMSTADAVIIGAGHNGLVAANLLADAGLSVVLEARGQAGGPVRSGEITSPGFVNDLCSAVYPVAAASPIMRGLQLEDHGLRWLHAPHVLAHLFRDDRAPILDRDASVSAATVEEFSAGDGDRWLEQVEAWERVDPDVIAALFTPFPPVRASVRLARHLGAADLLRLARQMVLPARRMTQEAALERRLQGHGGEVVHRRRCTHPIGRQTMARTRQPRPPPRRRLATDRRGQH